MPKRGGAELTEIRHSDKLFAHVPKMLTAGQFFGTAHMLPGGGYNTQSGASNNDSVIAFPVPIAETVSIDAMRVHVATAGDSGALVHLGIYLPDPLDNSPDALLIDAGSVAADTTGVKDATFTAITLKPGLYWFACLQLEGTSTYPLLRGQDPGTITALYYHDYKIDSNNASQVAWVSDSTGNTDMPTTFGSGNWLGGNGTPGFIYIQARVA